METDFNTAMKNFLGAWMTCQALLHDLIPNEFFQQLPGLYGNPSLSEQDPYCRHHSAKLGHTGSCLG